MVKYAPEVELLLCCAHSRLDQQKSERVEQLITAGLDWDYLWEIAEKHRIAPLLYWHLHKICPQAVPQASLVQLQQYYQEILSRNEFLTQELLKLLHLCEENQISALPFKGPVLTASAYGNLAFRRFIDLDILFHKQDVLKARDLLVAQGYENAEHLTEQQEIAQLESPYVKAYTYKYYEPRVIVELHWQLRATYSAFPLDYESLWKRLSTVSLADTTVPNLSPEDELLYLCAHGCGDRWQKLLQICDIAEAIRAHPTLNWQEMLAQASKLGCRRRLFLGLSLAQEFLQAEIPREIWTKIQADSSVTWLVKWVRQRLFRQADESIKVLDQARFDLVCLERRQDRGNYLRDRSILLIAKKFRLGFAKKYGLPGGK